MVNVTEVSLNLEKHLGLTQPLCVLENARPLQAHEMSGLTRHVRLKPPEQGAAQSWHHALIFNLSMTQLLQGLLGRDWEHKTNQ